MKSKFLSVVVPVYKTEKYLAKCLDSIICQTFRDIEIVCINDGSPDNSKEILSRYEQLDPRIVVLEIPNGGLSIARNVALDYIFNKSTRAALFDEHFIAFVDSDDYIDHSTFEKALVHFEGDIDAVSFGYERVSIDGAIIQERYNSSNFINLTGLVTISDNIILKTFPAVWSIIFKADIIKKYNLRFPERLRFEDNYFTSIYLLLSRSIYYIDAYPYKYLIRADSIMGKAKVNDYSIDFILIAKCIKSFLKANNLFETRENFFWMFFYYLIEHALNACKSIESESLIYNEATKLLKNTERKNINLLFDHYDNLLLEKNFKAVVNRRLFGLLKIKHVSFKDKFYFCGIEILSISYGVTGKIVKLLGIRVH